MSSHVDRCCQHGIQITQHLRGVEWEPMNFKFVQFTVWMQMPRRHNLFIGRRATCRDIVLNVIHFNSRYSEKWGQYNNI